MTDKRSDDGSNDRTNESRNDPFGDDQGTRVGHPSTPHRDNVEPSGKAGPKGEQGKSTGAGNEAAAGIHATNEGGSAVRPGSEPLENRENEHKSGYGGEGGEPRTSSDQR